MKKSMVRSGFGVLVLIVLALVVPFVSGWVDPASHPIITQGVVLEKNGEQVILRGDDGLDIDVRFTYGASLPYEGEHGIFYYSPEKDKDNRFTRPGEYILLGVHDFNPENRPKLVTDYHCVVVGKGNEPGNNWYQACDYNN